MNAPTLTKHAILRLSQRGIRLDDLELAELIGTEVEGGCLVRQKDAQTVVRELKKLIHQIERLPGKRVVRAADAVVTAYHANPAKQRRVLRRA
jgi:methyl coenzyme M reductase beta subunit